MCIWLVSSQRGLESPTCPAPTFLLTSLKSSPALRGPSLCPWQSELPPSQSPMKTCAVCLQIWHITWLTSCPVRVRDTLFLMASFFFDCCNSFENSSLNICPYWIIILFHLWSIFSELWLSFVTRPLPAFIPRKTIWCSDFSGSWHQMQFYILGGDLSRLRAHNCDLSWLFNLNILIAYFTTGL